MLVCMAMSIATVWGEAGYAVGNLKCILNDGSGTVVKGAGQVFVSLSAEVTPEWVADEAQSEVSSVEGSIASGWKHAFYYWAQANEGYRFIGFTTNSTSKTSSYATVPYKPYCTLWSASTAENPNVKQYYAIFEKLKKDDDIKPIDVTGMPTYEMAVATPADGAEVMSIRTITIHLYSEEYNDALTVLTVTPEVRLTKVKEGVRTPLDNKVMASVVTSTRGEDAGADLILTVEPAVADTCMLEVEIPMGITNNVPGAIATMTKEELGNKGFCTNPAMTLTYTLVPGYVQPIRITNQTDTVDMPDATLCYSRDSYEVEMGEDTVTMIKPNGQEVSYIDLHYGSELVSCLKADVIREMVEVRRVETGKKLDISQYSSGILERDRKCLRICLSTTSFINSVDQVGTYEVVIQSGIAVDVNGLKTGAVEFGFTYDHPTETSIDVVAPDPVRAHKCLNNGKLYIVRDGVRYDVMGTSVY